MNEDEQNLVLKRRVERLEEKAQALEGKFQKLINVMSSDFNAHKSWRSFDRISEENINDALDLCGGNPPQAAYLLGLTFDAMKHRADQLNMLLYPPGKSYDLIESEVR